VQKALIFSATFSYSAEHKADTWNTSATSPDLEEDKPILDIPSTWPPSESNDHKPVEQEPSRRRIDMPKHVELFRGLSGEDGDIWMRGFLKSAYEMNIARDEAEKLTYFEVCLAGDALDTFLSWLMATRTSWASVCEKWKEAYPSKVVRRTFAENFNDWADA
jgi:hypothetical protein